MFVLQLYPLMLMFGIIMMVIITLAAWRPKKVDSKAVGVVIGQSATLLMPSHFLNDPTGVFVWMTVYGVFGGIVGHVAGPVRPDSC